MGLPRSTFYDVPAAPVGDVELVAKIVVICDEFETYGYRRVRAELRHQGFVVNGKKIRRLMRENGLQPKRADGTSSRPTAITRVRFFPISLATTTAISSRPATIAGASRVELAITRQPALAPSPQPRAAPTGQALIARNVGRGGPYWMPIGGPDRTPLDKKGYSVAFTTAAALVHELMEARDERRLRALQKHLNTVKLLIVDELGYAPGGGRSLNSVRSPRKKLRVRSLIPSVRWIAGGHM
jgi:hypothetical protein